MSSFGSWVPERRMGLGSGMTVVLYPSELTYAYMITFYGYLSFLSTFSVMLWSQLSFLSRHKLIHHNRVESMCIDKQSRSNRRWWRSGGTNTFGLTRRRAELRDANIKLLRLRGSWSLDHSHVSWRFQKQSPQAYILGHTQGSSAATQLSRCTRLRFLPHAAPDCELSPKGRTTSSACIIKTPHRHRRLIIPSPLLSTLPSMIAPSQASARPRTQPHFRPARTHSVDAVRHSPTVSAISMRSSNLSSR